MIAIIDYGSGNLRSVQKAFEYVGAQAHITENYQDILQADKVVLPGVGAIAPAMEKLNTLGLVDPIKQTIASGKPFLGICLGLQLLFDESCEGGRVKTLSVLPGQVKKFTALKVPHMGWNTLRITDKKCPYFQGLSDLAHAYFCHSYFVEPDDQALMATTTDYGCSFASSVWRQNLFAVQFHPEKSQAVGLRILENFCKLPS